MIRRLSFDLIGLPPTPEEVDAFVADQARRRLRTLVDRLLASPHYGERWAEHWMDVARFAESHGYEQDYDRPFAYHYRDFLIRAFNQRPALRPVRPLAARRRRARARDPLALAATGFLGAGAFPTQFTEAEFESARYNELDDMTSTTGSAFLGLSVGCARCHDHKYDPDPVRDYYRIASTFTTTIRSEIDVPDATRKPIKMQVTAEGFPHTKHHADDRGFPHFYPKTFVLTRGDANQKKAEAAPGLLRVLTRLGQERSTPGRSPRRRAGRARPSAARRCALDDGHRIRRRALAARVIVNRLWQHHFGRGIVATPNDFGFQGERPTHPELLDWLALTSSATAGRSSAMQRLIVTSAVYHAGESVRRGPRQGRPRKPTALALYAAPARGRADSRRLAGVGGRLDVTMFGPGTLDPNMQSAERLLLHQAEPTGADDDAVRLARAPGQHRPAGRDHDRAAGA